MNGVQENLSFGGQSVTRSFAGRCFHAEHDLAGKWLAWFVERKSQDVSRSVTLEKSPVEMSDGVVIDQRDSDLCRRDSFSAQHMTNGGLELGGVDAKDALLVHEVNCDSMVDARPARSRGFLSGRAWERGPFSLHAVRCSGYLTRP